MAGTRARILLERLEPDAEALIVNRLEDPPQFVIAPIDQCYALVGLIKVRWEGISGGPALREAVPEFFASVKAKTNQPPRLRPPSGGDPVSVQAGHQPLEVPVPEPEFDDPGRGPPRVRSGPHDDLLGGRDRPRRTSRSNPWRSRSR